MKRPVAPAGRAVTVAVTQQLQQDREADTAQNHGHGDRQGDPRVVGVPREAVPAQSEARVVERGNGVEVAVVHRVADGEAVTVAKAQGKGGTDSGLDGEGGAGHSQQDPSHISDAQALRLRLGGELQLEAQLPGHQQGEQGRHGHDPETTELDQREDRAFTEIAPVRPRVHDRQPRHADGGRGCEEGGDEVGRRVRLRGEREGEQHRPDHDHGGEGHDNRAGRVRGEQSVPCRHETSCHLLPSFTRATTRQGRMRTHRRADWTRDGGHPTRSTSSPSDLARRRRHWPRPGFLTAGTTNVPSATPSSHECPEHQQSETRPCDVRRRPDLRGHPRPLPREQQHRHHLVAASTAAAAAAGPPAAPAVGSARTAAGCGQRLAASAAKPQRAAR